LATIQRRHAVYFLGLVEGAEGQRTWQHRLQAEQDNLRAVLAWSLSPLGDAELGLRIEGALGNSFWNKPGYTSEARAWLESFLVQSAGTTPPISAAARAQALAALGTKLSIKGEHGRAAALIEESLALYQEIGDRDSMAHLLVWLGRGARDQGNYPRAQTLEEQGLALFKEQGSAWGVGWAQLSLGDVALDQGDTAGATILFQNALDLFRQENNWSLGGWALLNLGRIAYAQGDPVQASQLFEETLARFRNIDYRGGVAGALIDLAHVARVQGNHGMAAKRLAESLALCHDVEDAKGILHCLEGLAGITAASRQPERAARLFSAAATLRESAAIPLPALNRADYDRDLAIARAQLDEATFAAAWAEGQQMSLEQAIAEALDRSSAELSESA
jgi:tetratricopeptide (TPR) repeat protein